MGVPGAQGLTGTKADKVCVVIKQIQVHMGISSVTDGDVFILRECIYYQYIELSVYILLNP